MKIDLNLLPSCPGDTDIQHIELGEHRYPALVVDGFYRDPDPVRALALALRYRAPPRCTRVRGRPCKTPAGRMNTGVAG
jgi:hypothetical protein